MKREKFTHMIDAIFAASHGDEMGCSDYFETLPRYVELEISGENAEAALPDMKHHMHQCPECEEVYLELLETLRAKK